MLVLLRCIALTSWAFFVLLRAPAFWRVLTGRARYYDVLWALLGAFALIPVGFNVRAPGGVDTPAVAIGLHLFSTLVALIAIRTVRAYQDDRRG